MELTNLTAISPIDGRYRKQVQHLDNYFSEFALIKYRVYVEVEYFFFLADKIARYRWVVSQQPPIFMIETFVSFAYFFKSATDCQTEKEREQMFTYFQQWTELTPALFNNRLNALIEIEYNHQDIGAAVQEINNFTKR